MRLAIIGTRGIPAAYGGFETFAEQLSERLARRGHDVTVYCRPGRCGAGDPPRGVRLVQLPSIKSKYLETVSHTALSALHSLPRNFDAVLMCNAANAAFAWIPRLAGVPVALNVDGLERQRRKWGRVGRAYYALSERIALVTPTRIVTDAKVIQDYYRRRYGADSTYIAYGTAEVPDSPPPPADGGPLATHGLTPRGYVLYVSRLEPENHAHTVVTAFAVNHRLPLQLVVTGDAPYAQDYIAMVKASADVRTVFTGGVYGDGYHELMAHAALYVHATTVGGVHPALVEAMGHGKAILAAGTPENRETLGDAGLYFEPGDAGSLARLLQRTWADPELCSELGRRAHHRAHATYSWDEVTSEYEELLASLVAGRRRRRVAASTVPGPQPHSSTVPLRTLPAVQTATSKASRAAI